MLSVHRITNTGMVSLGYRPVYKKCFITQYGPVGLLTGYLKSFREHYRYCPPGLQIGVTHHYVRRNTANLTLISISIYP